MAPPYFSAVLLVKFEFYIIKIYLESEFIAPDSQAKPLIKLQFFIIKLESNKETKLPFVFKSVFDIILQSGPVKLQF